MKFPKGLKAKRKSFAQALDEVENPPNSSFRVIDRQHGASKSFDGFTGGRKFALEAGRPLSYGPQEFGQEDIDSPYDNAENRPREQIFGYPQGLADNHRQSGFTVDSYSSGPANNSAASSMRLSSNSTVPSSTDLTLDTQKTSVDRKPLPESTSTPRPPSIVGHDPKSSEKTRSSIPRSKTPVAKPVSPRAAHGRRARAMTASSVSTATPPRLLESELSNGSDMDELGNMFDSLNKQYSLDEVSYHQTLTQDLTNSVCSLHQLCCMPHIADVSSPSLKPNPLCLLWLEKALFIATKKLPRR